MLFYLSTSSTMSSTWCYQRCSGLVEPRPILRGDSKLLLLARCTGPAVSSLSQGREEGRRWPRGGAGKANGQAQVGRGSSSDYTGKREAAVGVAVEGDVLVLPLLMYRIYAMLFDLL